LFENCSHSDARSFPLAAALAGLLLALAALCFALRADGPALDTAAGRCAYLASLGYEADPASEEVREVLFPEEFDAVLEDYNALQLSQGFDLRRSAGKPCLCCSYDLAAYPGWDGRVIATLYIRHGRLVGGDVHTASVNGFMAPLLPSPKNGTL
jgi:hypothetical protein